MVSTLAKNSPFMDERAVNVSLKKESETPPYNAPVHSENTGTKAKNETPPYNAPVYVKAGFGMFICEQCQKEVQRKVWNQRFCCDDCRLNWHRYKPTAKS